MKCPHCKKTINIGAILATVQTEAKRQASRENGKKGGRPRKKTKPTQPTDDNGNLHPGTPKE